MYGVGAMTFLFTLYPLLRGNTRKQKLLLVPVIFLGCALVATAIELAASYLCELTMGHWPWQTYARDYKIQFQGRIALSPSTRFGLGGLLFLYGLQPLFEKLVGRMKPRTRTIVFWVVLAVVLCDTVVFVLRQVMAS